MRALANPAHNLHPPGRGSNIHGGGSHGFVWGGAVNGGDIYIFPNLGAFANTNLGFMA
ncbi:MAG: hypothetical protein IT518_02800 [Burkholderiales bacterium]|nr:hypothetical protein [Burkholderiales bacterium]